MKRVFTSTLLFLAILSTAIGQSNYKNFKVTVYTRAYEVQKMSDQHWLDSTWEVISSQLDVDKIYLETHRDLLIVDSKTLKKASKFFQSKGIEVAGGITYTIDEGNLFETFCYTNPEHRKKAQEIIEHSAKHFDEVILDDFFFTSCKCNLCVEAKGDRSWSEYRLDLMTEAAENIILKPAHAVNPDVKVIIKYPNWYDHFHELGFNLETQPKLFDGIYTGTETRDAVNSNQHLQPYLGYLIFRYFNNLKPGKNGGGWVDTGGMMHFDRYAEQLWLTILAKAPEMNLFDYRQMLIPIRKNLVAPWSDEETSFNYGDFLPYDENATVASIASHAVKIIDDVAGELGEPVGIKSYKPFHSSGEDFLQNYFGMIGIPIDLVPEFPMDDDMLILTEQAKKDPEIIEKIKTRLLNGKDVVITSGLLKGLEDRGIKNLVNLTVTDRKAIVTDFLASWRKIEGEAPILISQIEYFTNDSWEIVSGMSDELGWPLFQMANVGKAKLYVLNVPDDYSDLYKLPVPVLDKIRQTICAPLGFSLSAPSKVSLFVYDNNTIVVESFNDETVEASIILTEKISSMTELTSKEEVEMKLIPEMKFRNRVFAPEQYRYNITLPPHSFKVLKMK